MNDRFEGAIIPRHIRDLYLESELIGSISLISDDTNSISMDILNYFLRVFCSNYRKVEIIKRICILKQHEVDDSRLLLARRSASILSRRPGVEDFLHKSDRVRESSGSSYDNEVDDSEDSEVDQSGYVTLDSSEMSASASVFWDGILSRERPEVLLIEDSLLKPIVDNYGYDAIKITALKFASPPALDARGLIGGLSDLVFAGKRNRREEETFINSQIGQTIDNMGKISRASQVISDEKTPPSVRVYAEGVLKQIQAQQERINRRLDIRLDRIDRTV